jgi:hypothetical protein
MAGRLGACSGCPIALLLRARYRRQRVGWFLAGLVVGASIMSVLKGVM